MLHRLLGAIMKKAVVIIVTLTLVHYLISLTCLNQAFGKGVAGYDTDLPPSPAELRVAGIAAILNLPMIYLIDLSPLRPITKFLQRIFGGYEGYFLYFCNSLLWAVCLYYLVSFVRRMWRRMRKGKPTPA
jgi:hypothetical protein